jgi:hypothetical protein
VRPEGSFTKPGPATFPRIQEGGLSHRMSQDPVGSDSPWVTLLLELLLQLVMLRPRLRGKRGAVVVVEELGGNSRSRQENPLPNS